GDDGAGVGGDDGGGLGGGGREVDRFGGSGGGADGAGAEADGGHQHGGYCGESLHSGPSSLCVNPAPVALVWLWWPSCGGGRDLPTPRSATAVKLCGLCAGSQRPLADWRKAREASDISPAHACVLGHFHPVVGVNECASDSRASCRTAGPEDRFRGVCLRVRDRRAAPR